MRSLADATASWQELKQYKTLTGLQESVRLDGGHISPAVNAGLRSASWKTFLLFDSVDTTTWPKTLAASRSAYNSLRMHFLRQLENEDELDDDVDSPARTAFVKDEELRAEIQQDVDRCMPENLFFRESDTQRILLDVLFIYAKLNPDLTYRQGMHELLAPIIWVLSLDAIALGPGDSKALSEEARTILTIFDADSVEADAFALFSRLMRSAKGFYEPTSHVGGENPIVMRSKRIFEDMLVQLDPELAAHLQKIEILPQIFMLRWIRLLFGREFPFEDVLGMWDVIFAEDPTLEIVDHISLAMILRIRWELLASDYNSALTLLLRYPSESPPDRDHIPPQSLVLDAVYLRTHLSPDGCAYLVLKYTGRHPQPPHRPATPPALQRNITTFSGINTLPSPPRPSTGRRQPTNLEAVLQSTAQRLYAKGGQAVRGAVVEVSKRAEEVHKRAQEIQRSPTPSLPPRLQAGDPRTLERRLQALERRNHQLAKLLEGAVGQLWEYQRTAAEHKAADDEKADTDVESLSVAIARVQFVQVYLEDASLPLPENDLDERSAEGGDERDGARQLMISDSGSGHWSTSDGLDFATDEKSILRGIKEQTTMTDRSPAAHSDLADPSTFEDESDQPTPKDESVAEVPEITVQVPEITATPSQQPVSSLKSEEHPKKSPESPQEETAATKSLKSHRPTISEGSYSWMLGQDAKVADESPRKKTLASTPSKNGAGGLFGDGEDDADGITVVHSSRRGKRGKQRAIVEKVDGDHGALAAEKEASVTR
ncbi:hypothetical protein LTR17_024971 [Elasticomyces elasticus]|nr:hypothetical protein LTR17_024971 [Elasticomyces elasticus]